MSLANLSLPDLIGSLVGLVLTLAVFSYLLGDNALFRVAVHIFTGVAAGYAVVMAWNNVLWPQLVNPLVYGQQADQLYILFPLLLGGLLMFKISPRLARLGNPAVAYLVGVGVATAIGGSIMGTIFPQVMATANLFAPPATASNSQWWWSIGTGVIILVGTAATLLYFQFGVRSGPENKPGRPSWVKPLAWLGQIFIAITLGSIFAGVYMAALSAFVERLDFLVSFVMGIIR